MGTAHNHVLVVTVEPVEEDIAQESIELVKVLDEEEELIVIDIMKLIENDILEWLDAQVLEEGTDP